MLHQPRMTKLIIVVANFFLGGAGIAYVIMMHYYSRFSGAILLTIATLLLASCDQPPSSDEQIENLLELLELPANQWVEYHHIDNGSWWKKGHAGLAYDSKRGSLLIFGSDSHGEDWDNTVHEFLPNQRRWVQHGENAPRRERSSSGPVSLWMKGTGSMIENVSIIKFQ